jgi:hypothetical protein
MSWYGAFSESVNSKSSKSSSISDIPGDPAKIAEAIAIVGEKQVRDRGGVNAQGYFGDVPEYRQLTAQEYKDVTINNPGGSNHGHINSMAMLAKLNQKEAEHNAKMGIVPRNDGVLSGGPLPTTSITATPPAPDSEMFSARMFAAPPPVKTATLDIILFDEENIPTDGMFDQIFENIGGQELISITRSDIVNGQKISYQPIKNLSAIQQRYNPNNILSLQQTADKFFAGFSIKLEDKIPETGNGTNGENVYLNAAGDLIIEFINVNPDEQIETQISVSGTIYEADLGDYTS